MAYSASDLKKNILNVRTNPMEIQRVQLEALEAAMEGSIDIVDASNPFIFLLEANAACGAAAMEQVSAITRPLYPSLAVTEDDLYRHMTDVDYLGRFALPASTQFILSIDYNQLINAVVSYGDAGVKKLVIPRNTNVSVDGVNFGMQYPIEIRLMPHGGFQVVYLNDLPSPLWSLTSNLVNWKRSTINTGGDIREWMQIYIDMKQFTLTTNTQPINTSSPFNRNYQIVSGQYYYCRVYGLSSDGITWIEYNTTHSDQVYDAKSVTAKLKVTGTTLNVQIPLIYTNSNMLGAQLRVDIYTTQGPINMNLAEYDPSAIGGTFNDYDNGGDTTYTAPLAKLDKAFYSDDTAIGGSDPIDFDTLREQVIQHNTYVNTPITGAQLETAQKVNGFTIVKAKDVITSRTYAASQALPAPSSASLKAGAGTLVSMLETSMEDLTTRSTVVDNDTSVTIKPTTLFRLREGVLSVVGEPTYQSLMSLAQGQYYDDLMVTMTEQSELVYTPWHYVLDTVDNTFRLGAYHLESPDIGYRSFVAENASAQLLVGTGSVTLSRIDSGYRLTVETESGDTYKSLTNDQTHVQLAYKPVNESDYAYITGTLVGTDASTKERVFQFDIPTTYYINGSDQIQFAGFSLYDNEIVETLSELTQEFYLLWSVSDYSINDLVQTDIDLLIYKDQLPANAVGISQESLTLEFGTALTWLWKQARTVKDSVVYETYTQDVLMFYPANVYETDDQGNRRLVKNDAGEWTSILLHTAGDPVLDDEGNQRILYAAGDVKTINGEPIEAGPRKVVRHLDLMLVDARFYFATEANDVSYRVELADAVLNYLVSIADINERLLENTELYYVPVTTLGDIDVLVGAGMETTISSTQAFTVYLYLTQTAYNNETLKATFKDKVQTIIHDALTNATFSVDGLGSLIGSTLGDDIMAVYVNPIGTNNDLTVFTAMDEVTRCSVQRKLVVLPDNTLQVQDAIDVQFIRHQRTVDTSTTGS